MEQTTIRTTCGYCTTGFNLIKALESSDRAPVPTLRDRITEVLGGPDQAIPPDAGKNIASKGTLTMRPGWASPTASSFRSPGVKVRWWSRSP